MQVILLQRVEKLGMMGQIVEVKPGYARNYLLPQKKALRATADNVAIFETRKIELEAKNLHEKAEAEFVAEKMSDLRLVVIRQAGESGQLYGSVSPRDIAEQIVEGGFKVQRNQVLILSAIKTLGVHSVSVILHPEVSVSIDVVVAQTVEEAKTIIEKAIKAMKKENSAEIADDTVIA